MAFLFPSTGQSSEILTGFSAIEEGDQRFRPAVTVRVAEISGYGGQTWLYGSRSRYVEENKVIVSGFKSLSLFGTRVMRADLGFSLLFDRQIVKYFSPEGQRPEEDNFNAGGYFALGWRLPGKKLVFQLNWESHLFLAGLAGLYLATGRNQGLTCAIGMQL
jgi:hypothetical protein